MVVRAFILRVITRPVLVPIGVGSFGLWYGGFDITYIVSRKIALTIYPDLSSKTSSTNRIISSLAALSTGSTFAYFNYVTSPFKTIEFPELDSQNIFRQLPMYFKRNIQVIKSINLTRGIFLFVGSGCISGFCKCIVETYLSNHL